AVQIRIPFVAKYVPSYQRPRNPIQQIADPERGSNTPNGSIVARYTADDGGVIFAIVSKQSGDLEADEIEEIEVRLANIYEHVTPRELERFEHKEWEKEIERESRRRKVGRPRRKIRSSMPAHEELEDLEKAMKLQKTKKPLGRSRKKPSAAIRHPTVKGGSRVVSNFQAVLIQSPNRREEQIVDTSSSSDSTNSSLQSSDTPMPDSGATLLNVDQLTPSNAARVVADSPLRVQPSPSKAHLRPSLMVEAALGNGIISDEDHGLSDAIGSEDELTAASPNINHRVAHRARIAPTHNIQVNHGARHTSNHPRQSDVQPPDEPVHQTTPQKSRTDGNEVRKSMTPHFPSSTRFARHHPIQSPSRPPRRGVLPAQILGVIRDADEIFALLNGDRNMRLENHSITLGDPYTSSDEDDNPQAPQESIGRRPTPPMSVPQPSQLRTYPFEHRMVSRDTPVMTSNDSANLTPRSQPPQIILSQPITNSSDAAKPSSEARNEADGSTTKKRRRSSPDSEEGWYRLVRR
ncbi:MAG: hypothetical protein Q9194_003430, partial [Teloschistes cf. exilis]